MWYQPPRRCVVLTERVQYWHDRQHLARKATQARKFLAETVPTQPCRLELPVPMWWDEVGEICDDRAELNALPLKALYQFRTQYIGNTPTNHCVHPVPQVHSGWVVECARVRVS